ncbi:MAG: heavy metal transporter [Anaerolineae bacterium]|jgi:copper chaperone CopZ|nr:MAG: heavy metal transporter [Anaerolineae bacterium]
MSTVTYRIPNISCHHCVHTIQSELSEVEGVKSVVAEVESKTAQIEFDAPATEEILKKVLAEINYPVEE